MKKLLFILGISFLCITLNAQTPYYYYSKGQKQYLSLNTEYAFLSLKEPKVPEDILARHITYTDLISDKSDKKEYKGTKGKCRFYTRLKLEDDLSDEQYWALLSDIQQKNDDVIISPYFNAKGRLGLSNFFYVKLKEEKDTTVLRQIAEQNRCIIVEQDAFMPLWFTLSITDISELNALENCNAFFESKLFQATEPSFIYDNMLLCVNDPYFVDQWGLKNTGQFGDTVGIDIKSCEAWQLSTGNNTRIAVIDVGIQSNHPDLVNNMDSLSYNCSGDSMPQHLYLAGAHGTMCAAIAGAIQNNEGMSGVAPNCRLIPISFDVSVYNESPIEFVKHAARGINWAWKNGADVISNSWGVDSLYALYIKDAIDSAVIRGRNGKGCVLTFGSGNGDSEDVLFPARLPNVIAVGAIHPCGHRKETYGGYVHAGSYGMELDVVSPGMLVLTTVLDDYGISQYFNLAQISTSLATPHVSGVAALIISVNPNLTGQEVRDIIESTAQKVGGYNYQTTSGRPNGTWHIEMGYGLVDAHAAVLAALETRCNNGHPAVYGIINHNTTWNAPLRAVGDIVIPSGVTLTITDSLTILSHVSILVRPGGKLVIDGGTLTNACENEMWQGITVLGDPTKPMLPIYQGYLELRSGVTIQNAEMGIAVKGGGFVVEDNVIIQNLSGGILLENAKSESIPWFYDGNIEYNLNNITFENTPLTHHGTRLSISNCIFNQGSDVETSVSISEMDNCIFENTSFLSDNSAFPRGGQTVPYTNVGNCQFFGNNNISAIQLNKSRRNHIYNNVISGYGTGISLSSSGGTLAQSNGIVNGFISGNNISNCGIGITLYNSAACISANKIHNNVFGVKLYNNSYTTLNNKHIEPYQIIQNCSSIEFYTTPCSFPAIIRFNQIMDNNNLGNNYGDPLFCVDVDFCCMRVRELSCNYWGGNFVHADDIYPPDAFRTDIIWTPGQSCLPIRDPDEILYQIGLDYFSDEDYINAENTFKELISNHPDSHFSIAALHELFALEYFTNNDFATLQIYLASFSQNDSVLFNTADFLATRCFVMEREWQPAIDWYEHRIENPLSYQDSVFAVIDLGDIHLMMDNDTLGGSGTKSNFCYYRLTNIKPQSRKEYLSNKANLLATLPQIKKSQTERPQKPFARTDKKGTLGQCIPNPTTGNTTITYEIYTESTTEINIYNVYGQLLRTLSQGKQKAGCYQTRINVSGLPAGMYHYSLIINGERTDTKKMIVN